MLLQDVADRIGFDGSMTRRLDDGMAVDGLRYCSMDDGIRGSSVDDGMRDNAEDYGMGNSSGDDDGMGNTSQKSYWKIINRVMCKCRTPKIPPLFVHNLFILNCREKAKYFNDFFCTTVQACYKLIKNYYYRPKSLLPICGKFLEKLIFNKPFIFS